uniref:RNA replication protein n=1 Tax=Yam virus X TaxID=1503864 RepID=A0A0B4VM15_9VIRU|nr:putative RNA-dependent RNA polymerase [Yam virus X]
MSQVNAVLERLTDSSVRAVLQEGAYRNIRPILAKARAVNPYVQTSNSADVLEKLGILTNPYNINVHTHAACKAIENRLLEILGSILPQDPVTFLFLKRSKLGMMHRDPNKNRDLFYNQHLEPRDLSRYAFEDVYKTIPQIQTPVAYISDTLHFWEPEDLCCIFRSNPMLDTLYATLVLPPEAYFKHPSAEPHLYQISYNYGGFQYIPGGHGGGSYHHEFKSLQWLEYGKLHYSYQQRRHYITCQMIESLGANHLFVFQRGDLLTPRVRVFKADEFVSLPKIFSPSDKNCSRPIKKIFAMQMLLYIKSIKSPSERDIYAKIRQLIQTHKLDEFDPQEIVHIANYFYFISQLSSINSYQELLSCSWFKKNMWYPVRDWIVNRWENTFGMREFAQLLKALEWETFTYSIEVREYRNQHHIYNPNLGHIWDLPANQVENNGVDLFKNVLEGVPATQTKIDIIEECKAQDEQMEKIFENSNRLEELKQLPWFSWLKILNAAGFKGDQEQYNPADHSLIYPISDINTLPKVEGFFNLFEEVPMKLINILCDAHRSPVKVNFDHHRASMYASDVKNHRIGAHLKQMSTAWKAEFSLRCEQDDVSLYTSVIHGAGGSGKSNLIQNYMRSLPRNSELCTVVVPTNELRIDWESKVPLLNRTCFKTFEKALVQGCGPVVIFDDYSKLPAGCIEAHIMTHPNIELVILTGDSRQSFHHESNTEALITHLPPATEIYSPHCRYYLNATHRNRRDLANILGVYSEVEGTTAITMSSQIQQGIPILCPSTVKKDSLNDLGRSSMTYAGCQGLTAKKIQILLDTNTYLCSNNVMYTALSRAVDSIHFINTGPNSQEYWTKLDATPYLKTFLELFREEKFNDVVAEEPVVTEPPPPQTHLPVDNAHILLDKMVEEQGEKYDRELFASSSGHTNCIQTNDPIVQIFQHQQARDETLFWKTMDVRVSNSTPIKNEIEFVLKKDIGDILFLNYQHAMNLPKEPIPFDKELWTASAVEVQNKYLEKPIHALINANLRQSPDFDAEGIMIFLKSQWVKKTEKLGILNVKPGQTIAAFMQETVMLYGTMARYMRKMRNRYNPRNIFINCEKNPEELSSFIKDSWNFNNSAHSNDFTAFDQSQDGAMLQFEVIKAKHHCIPEPIIEGYIHLKTHAKIFTGTLAIMRLTGEGPTFDANTECAIAYHFTKYHHNPNDSYLFAGDDSAMDNKPIVKISFDKLSSRLKLTAKEKIYKQKPGDYAEFCGNLITPAGLIKSPLKLYASLELAERTGNLKNCVKSYAEDCSLAYKLGDDIHNVLDTEEMIYHQSTVRKLVKHHQSEVLQPGLSSHDSDYELDHAF